MIKSTYGPEIDQLQHAKTVSHIIKACIAYDCETYNLQPVGLFMLNKLSQKFKNSDNIGLYRDDGLAPFRNMGPRTADRIRQQFSEIFHQEGLKITVTANMKIGNFLDTLNLLNGKFYPYRKPDNNLFISTPNSTTLQRS